MPYWDFDEIETLIDSSTGRAVELSAASFAILLCVLSDMTKRYAWKDGSSVLSDSQWDTADEWVSNAYLELMTEVEVQMALPIGTLVPLLTNSIPSHYLWCAPGSYAKVDYPELYDLLPTQFITDANYFTLPDMRDNRFLMGTGDIGYLGDTGGESEHTLTIAEMPAHEHGIDLSTVTGAGHYSRRGSNSHDANTTGSAGGGQAHNNLPPYMKVAWAIVAKEAE